MKKKKLWNMVGNLAFLGGAVLSFIMALVTTFSDINMGTGIAVTLITLGIIIGILNISRAESTGFMVAVLLIGISSGSIAGLLQLTGVTIETLITALLANIGILVTSAGFVVAITHISKVGTRKGRGLLG